MAKRQPPFPHGRLVWKVVAMALLLLQLPETFTAGSLQPLEAKRVVLGAVKEQDVVTVDSTKDQDPIPLRDAAQSADSKFLADVDAATQGTEVLQLLTQHRQNLRLAESTHVMEKLLELTSEEELAELLKETVLVDVLRFQVDAIKTLHLRPAQIIPVASLALRLPSSQGEVLLTTALQALKPKTMRMSEMKELLSSPLSGIEELRHAVLDVMAELVHRMSPEVMVVVLKTLAEYEEQRDELLDDILERARQKSFRMTPHEGVGLLHALAQLQEFDKALLVHFSSQAAVDMSPYSVEEVCQWAEILRRLDFRNEKLLNILVKVTTWRAASMSAEQVNTMLRCFEHFMLPDESIISVQEIVQTKERKMTDE